MSHRGQNLTANTPQVWNGSRWVQIQNVQIQDSGANGSVRNDGGNLTVGVGVGNDLIFDGGTDPLIWPATDGTAEAFLTTDGAGALQWSERPTMFVEFTGSGGAATPYDFATFNTPPGDSYLWLITGIVGVENTTGSEGQAAYINLFSLNNGLATDQTLGFLQKPPGAKPTGVMWFQLSTQLILPANESITFRATVQVEDGSDATCSILKYFTTLDYQEGFVLQALSKQAYP